MQNKLRLILAAVLVAGGGTGLWLALRPAPEVSGRISRSALEMKDGLLCLKFTGQPYSGVVYEQAAGGGRLTELHLRGGKLQGLSRGWHDSGALEVEEFFQDGLSDGIRRRWHANGQLKSQAEISRGVLHGTYTEWHENGTMAARMTHVQGRAEGLCEAWHPGGALKARVMMKAGEAVAKEHFPDPAAGAVASTDNSNEAREEGGK